MRIHTNAAMCQACIHARRQRGKGVVSCRKTDEPITRVISLAQCPIGKHDRGDGITRCGGLRYYGAPWFVQLAWRVVWRRRTPLAGCGCLVWLKERWVRLTGATPKEPALVCSPQPPTLPCGGCGG